MELWIMLEKVVLCLHHHLPRRAIYCLRVASREAATAVMAQHPEHSPEAESSSPSRVQARLEMLFFKIIIIINLKILFCSAFATTQITYRLSRFYPTETHVQQHEHPLPVI